MEGQTMFNYPGRVGKTVDKSVPGWVPTATENVCATKSNPCCGINEPNNWPRCTATDTDGSGEHGIGFMNGGGGGYALNDWRRSNLQPFMCEVQRAHFAAGSYVKACMDSCTGVASVNITRLTDPTAAVASSFKTELVVAGFAAGRGESNVYLPCRYPPGLYNFNAVDRLGRASTSWPFNLQATSPVIAAPTRALTTAFNNESVIVSWAGTGAPYTTSPEFAKLQLSQLCVGGAALPPVALGAPVDTARFSAVVALNPIRGCASNTYLVRAQPVGCAAEYGANFNFGPYLLSARPEVLRVLQPTCAAPAISTPWYPGLPLVAHFAIDFAPAAGTTVTVSLVAGARSAAIAVALPAGAAVGAVDIGARYTSCTSLSTAFGAGVNACAAGFSFTLALSSSSSAATAASCPIAIASPAMNVAVGRRGGRVRLRQPRGDALRRPPRERLVERPAHVRERARGARAAAQRRARGGGGAPHGAHRGPGLPVGHPRRRL